MATCKADALTLAHFGHGSSTGVANIDQALRRFHISLFVPGDATGGEATERQHCYFYLDKGLTAVSAQILPLGALTANDTNYKTIAIGTDDGAGGTHTAIGTLTTKITGGSGDWVAGTAESVSTVTMDDAMTAGTYLSVKVTKAASGVLLPNFVLDLIVERT